jgi:hypothetical protein
VFSCGKVGNPSGKFDEAKRNREGSETDVGGCKFDK